MINPNDLVLGDIYYLVDYRGDPAKLVVTSWEYKGKTPGGGMHTFDDPSGLSTGKLVLENQELQRLLDKRQLDAELRKTS